MWGRLGEGRFEKLLGNGTPIRTVDRYADKEARCSSSFQTCKLACIVSPGQEGASTLKTFKGISSVQSMHSTFHEELG
jgi:hypothetical protein